MHLPYLHRICFSSCFFLIFPGSFQDRYFLTGGEARKSFYKENNTLDYHLNSARVALFWLISFLSLSLCCLSLYVLNKMICASKCPISHLFFLFCLCLKKELLLLGVWIKNKHKFLFSSKDRKKYYNWSKFVEVCASRFLRSQISLLPNPYLYRNVIFHKAGKICFVIFDVLVELFLVNVMSDVILHKLCILARNVEIQV